MNFKEKYGPYALITGASSGIGVELANLLAQKGLNLVLVARREERLKKLAEKLKTTYNIEALPVGLDLTDKGFIDKLRKVTDELNIGLLVSNAGQLYVGNYLDNPLSQDLHMIDLNIKAPAILTHHYVNKMLDRKKSGIIYVASMLGYMGTPYASTYAATKAHEIVKGEGLAHEFKEYGIDVLVVNPGLTDTEMTDNNDFSSMPMKLMAPAKVAKDAIGSLGHKTLVTPGLMNKMLVGMSKRLMSRGLNSRMFGFLMKKAI